MKPATFVSVGNATQPFGRMLEMVRDVVADLPKPVLVQRGRTMFDHQDMEVVDFVSPDAFSAIVVAADVLIVHGGAGSVLQAVAAGRTPIVICRRFEFAETVDDHQTELVERLCEAGRIRRADCSAELRAALREASSLRQGSTLESAGRLLQEITQLLASYSQDHGKSK